jgi:hypothetical protein
MNHDVSELTIEQLLCEADELLRCAKATAYECADIQHGERRDHAFGAVHLIQMAHAKVMAALRAQETADVGRVKQ